MALIDGVELYFVT